MVEYTTDHKINKFNVTGKVVAGTVNNMSEVEAELFENLFNGSTAKGTVQPISHPIAAASM